MSATKAAAPYYYVPGPSRWPVLTGMSLLVTMIGASAWVNDIAWGMAVNLIGIAATVDKANQDAWFRNVEEGKFDATFRWTNGGATPYDIYQTVMDGKVMKKIGRLNPRPRLRSTRRGT